MDTLEQTTRVSAGTRVYYFDARVDRKGQRYIAISEIPTERAPKDKKRQRIFVHAENIDAFIKALAEVRNHIKDEPNG